MIDPMTPPSAEAALRAWIADALPANDASHDLGHVDAVATHVKRIVHGLAGRRAAKPPRRALPRTQTCDAKYGGSSSATLSELGVFLAPLATSEVRRLPRRAGGPFRSGCARRSGAPAPRRAARLPRRV